MTTPTNAAEIPTGTLVWCSLVIIGGVNALLFSAMFRYYSHIPRGPRPRGNYAEYLNLYYLLDLQRDDENVSSDEQHFITVHQIFELWFKMIIREMEEVRQTLVGDFVAEKDVPRIVHKLTRCTKIFQLIAQQWKVVETLAPQDFLRFRNRLGTASGFESFQIRELEMILGLKQHHRNREMDPVKHFKVCVPIFSWQKL